MPFNGAESPGLRNISGWINSGPLEITGGVYLLHFWRHGCPDCLEDAREMQKIHRTEGITVLGVHSPELGFEEKEENVRKAVKRHGIDYPVALDSQGSTLEAHGERYSPRHVLVCDGKIEWQNSGESSFRELGEVLANIIEEQPDLDTRKEETEVSPDLFLGWEKSRGLNEDGNVMGERDFEMPGHRRKNEAYLDGRWVQGREFLRSVEEAKLSTVFQASEVRLVADPGSAVKDVEVLVNSQPVTEKEAGEDVRIEGGRSYLRLKDAGVYSVLKGGKQEAELTLEPEKGVEVYTLTFR